MFVKYTYLKKFLKYDKIIRRDHLVTCRIVHFAYLTVRREIKSFESDILTPTSKGRSGNRNHTYLFFGLTNEKQLIMKRMKQEQSMTCYALLIVSLKPSR